MAPDTQATLRLRKKKSTEEQVPAADAPVEDAPRAEDVVWGKTPSGEVFRVPTTHDVLTLFNPTYPKSHFDLVNLGLLGFQIALFLVLPRSASKVFFFFYFALWRAAYDAGLGWVLTKQSKKKWIVKEVQRLGWLDEKRMPEMRDWIRKQLAGKMGKDYSFDELPLEYNTWLLFRQVVDIILLNDFVAYCMFAFACFRVPDGLSFATHVMRWIGGLALIAFNLWVKTEAHHVVKDYGWYWGDVFFQRGALVFDGVFELAPHPMYSVGYAGYYGLSLIVGSYAVLFVSLAAHAAQFGFLVFFENPHIERTYGQRKLLAQRTPLLGTATRKSVSESTSAKERGRSQSTVSLGSTTPSATEGETGTETDGPDTEYDSETENEGTRFTKSAKARTDSTTSFTSVAVRSAVDTPLRSKSPVSQHDLFNQFFRKDMVILHNLDPFRATDFQLVLVTSYVLAWAFLPPLSYNATLALLAVHTLAWVLFHSFGLGLVLRAQSERKFLVRHFLKHYYYPRNDGGKGAVYEAFSNWKSIYNMSMCMTYASFIGLTWKTYHIPHNWTVGNELLRHTMGALLVALHVWATLEQYEVLGMFGWFFGDFFMEESAGHLEYNGIYRYLNNPESISGAAFFGLALISGSKLVFTLAVIRHLSQWWFMSKVENPHMRRLYGDSLRSDAGFVKVIKKVAQRNARLLERRAGRHAPEIKRVAREVKGTFDKVYGETAEVLEEFLAKSKPRISEVVQETKVLLQQSREKLVISRVASDISRYDSSKYGLSIVPSSTDGTLRYHLGESIRVRWKAPQNHSRKDWIGIYRVGANASTQVTKVSSLGMWVPVHNEEWDGDIPLGSGTPAPSGSGEYQEGEVVFRANQLPWKTGMYEIRYHHDGKYNVMGLAGPIEIYVDKPATATFPAVRASLAHIVTLALDADPSLVPVSCKELAAAAATPAASPAPVEGVPDAGTDGKPSPATGEGGGTPAEEDGIRDPDDFRFWSENQAVRISKAIKEAFGVELTPEVIIADANLGALANRILVARDLFEG
ncbi:phosphatidylethanolamine N-methyltransferase [Phanerochaete sordida]|uniref:Phosphatidylethanolamine N-methyltransferase n=1 Tax=Phanerochaete sordida TaxID=48140 RepID=A0A9P3G647_9APHY|nr:phosphatidylethanolamine N-methyltransferase [Phanerochaete sordida]